MYENGVRITRSSPEKYGFALEHQLSYLSSQKAKKNFGGHAFLLNF